MIFGGNGQNTFKDVNKKINEIVKPLLEKWCQRELSENLTVYGIRRYLRGAWMRLHVDKCTHIVSAIFQVQKRICHLSPGKALIHTGQFLVSLSSIKVS